MLPKTYILCCQRHIMTQLNSSNTWINRTHQSLPMLPALVGHCDNRSQAVSSHSMPGNTMPIRGEYKSQSTWRRWVPTPIAIASKSITRSTSCYNCISNWTVNSWTLFVPNPLKYYSVKNVVIGLTFIQPCCQSLITVPVLHTSV